MKKLYKILSYMIFAAILIAGFMAYIIKFTDPDTHIITDGLGRELNYPPVIISILLTGGRFWAGLGWHLFDVIWFFGGLMLANYFLDKSKE